MPNIEKLTVVFEDARRLVDDADNNFDWSFWADRQAALAELDGLLHVLRSGELPRPGAMEVLFAPTGPLQEVSLSSGWGNEFATLADRFDSAMAESGAAKSCGCLESPVQGFGHAVELGMDRENAEVSLLTCPVCGRYWLRYFYENEAFSKSGRWYLGEISKSRVNSLRPEDGRSILGELQWYFYCGSYFDGKTGRSSGPINL